MKILLVNPNRYQTPPVPPLGLEYLAESVIRSGHECRILDLCFSDDPLGDIARALDSFSPDIAGLTVRNIDTVLRWNNEFFLDEFRRYVSVIRASGTPVVLGGAGYSFIPQGVRRFLGADYGVSGPGERAFPRFLDRFARSNPQRGTVVDGREDGIDPDFVPRRGGMIDHTRYLREGGILGFETQKGCYGRCPYCGEGNRAVLLRNPEAVAEELAGLAAEGFTEFHLCDSEFNQDLDHAKAVLEAMIRRVPGIRWALYMKSEPYDDDFFRLLARSGAHLVTLSIPTSPSWRRHLPDIRRLTRLYGIRLAVDYLCGLPDDTPDTVRRDIEFLRSAAPDTVGVNSAIRLHHGPAVTQHILGDPDLRPFLSGALERNPDLIRPVFFVRITPEELRDIIGGDPRFTIEGFERTSNYQRLRER